MLRVHPPLILWNVCICYIAVLLFHLQQVSAKNYNTWFEAIRFKHFLKKALLFRQTSEGIFIQMDHLWALTLKWERHKVRTKIRAIEKSDKLLNMGSGEHPAENLWSEFKYIWHWPHCLLAQCDVLENALLPLSTSVTRWTQLNMFMDYKPVWYWLNKHHIKDKQYINHGQTEFI